MKHALATIVLLFCGCVAPDLPSDAPEGDIFVVINAEMVDEKPIVNLPYTLRFWNTRNDGGSCVHRSMGNLFNWMGYPEWADYWTATYTGGEYPDDTFHPDSNLAQKLEAEGIPFVYTLQKNDVEFLEWAIKTRRGCNVTVMGGIHMVTLVHLDAELAGILDNNDPTKILWVTRQSFLNEWFNSNSWAVTPLFDPVPPL